MIKHIRLTPFIAGIAVGLLLLFFYQTPQTVLYQYPHPQNVDERVYRDKIGVCYKYSAKEVDCDKNEATIRTYPIQG